MPNELDNTQESDAFFNWDTLDEIMNEDFVDACLDSNWGFTDEQLKILCRIRPCRVDMTIQNYYYAYQQDRVRLITEKYGATRDKKEILDFVHYRFMLKFEDRYKCRISDPLKKHLENRKRYGLAYSKFASSFALQRYALKLEGAEDQKDEDEMSSNVSSPTSNMSTGTIIHVPSQSQGSQQKPNTDDDYDFFDVIETQPDIPPEGSEGVKEGSESQPTYSEFNNNLNLRKIITSTQNVA